MLRSHRHYVAIEGPIGVGKTTLATRLAERFDGRVVLEQVDENPFLAAFYDDPLKHAFQAQMFFLLSRYQQQQELRQQDLFSQITLADYVFAKDRIFAALTLRPDEHALYERVAALLDARVARPDLVVYLQARPDVLLSRIRKRGRDFERHIRPEYLDAVSKAYSDFFFHYEETPLLVVNANDVDLATSDEELDALVNVIRKHRAGTQHYVPLGTRAG
jgi:deoxyadenosine/deoxycytidine kinase